MSKIKTKRNKTVKSNQTDIDYWAKLYTESVDDDEKTDTTVNEAIARQTEIESFSIKSRDPVLIGEFSFEEDREQFEGREDEWVTSILNYVFLDYPEYNERLIEDIVNSDVISQFVIQTKPHKAIITLNRR